IILVNVFLPDLVDDLPEEEEDIELDIEEEENDSELIFPYVEANPLIPLPPAPDSESKDVVEDTIMLEDETVPNIVYEKGKAKDKYYSKLIADLERVECKKLKKELEDARLSNTLLSMQKERVERDLYWARVQAHEFYREMIHRGVMFEERPNEAIDVLVKDEESPSSEPRESPRDS
nr:hypothetical protein [Tanacetum cinerariifolium]